MSEEQTINRSEILPLRTEIVSAHVSNNPTGRETVPDLIQSVFDKLSALTGDEPVAGRRSAHVAMRSGSGE